MEISMARGDLETVSFTIETDEGLYTEADEIYFTVKKTFINKNYLIQKKLGDGSIQLMSDDTYEFRIMPDDTNSLDYGKYVFDIEVVKDGSIKKTFVGDFYLTHEVTFADNE